VSRRFAVIVDECAEVAHPNPRAVNLRPTPNAGQNFRFQPETMAVGLRRELDAVEMDWLALVVSLYATDLACPRGHGDLDWGRDIELHVPLREPAVFEAHIVALQEVFADLTGDRLRIHLHPDPDPMPAPRYGKEWPDFDSVALFSGGVDSFVGAARLLQEGRRPLLLSHGSGANTTPQRLARNALTETFGSSPDARVSTNQMDGFPEAEESQRARSLLFMGAAALVAAVQGVEDVYINENGVMAVHVALTPARFGSLSTKTAYPPIVERIEAIAAAVLGGPLRIRNNLIGETKPEVVTGAKGLGVDGALAQTASCWTWQRGRRHCGVCVPCLIRRISFEDAGVAEPPHAADPFDVPLDVRKPFAHDNMAHLCQVVQEIDGLADAAFELEHPEILDGGRMLDPSSARDLYRRWAGQALTVLERHPVSRDFLD
jgi:7-cyano-7-deazaguanine synthase in queuosine biosynthesis